MLRQLHPVVGKDGSGIQLMSRKKKEDFSSRLVPIIDINGFTADWIVGLHPSDSRNAWHADQMGKEPRRLLHI